jgi:hypothetical protein
VADQNNALHARIRLRIKQGKEERGKEEEEDEKGWREEEGKREGG